MAQTAEDFLPKTELKKIKLRAMKFFNRNKKILSNNSMSEDDVTQECYIVVLTVRRKFPDIEGLELFKAVHNAVTWKLNELLKTAITYGKVITYTDDPNEAQMGAETTFGVKKAKKGKKTDNPVTGNNNILDTGNSGVADPLTPILVNTPNQILESPSLTGSPFRTPVDDTETEEYDTQDSQGGKPLSGNFLRAKELAKILPLLPEDQRNIFLLHAKDGMTFREIGTELGISKQRVNIIYQETIAKLRVMLS